MAGRFVLPLSNLFDAFGNKLANGTLEFYQTATSTPLDTYSDFARTVVNDNPVNLDANGLPDVEIFLLAQAYKVVVKSSAGTILKTYDPVWPTPGLNDSNTFTKAQIRAKGADTASATTVVVGTDGDIFDMTGTTTVTGFTIAKGREVTYQFDGAVLLTHHATNLILPGAANITTAAGDILNLTAYDTDKVYGTFHPADGRAVVGALTLSTAQATTSGTSKDFTSIPAWVKRITVEPVGVSGNGTSPLMIQIGTSGAPVATGYSGATASITASPSVAVFTTGFVLSATNAAALVWYGSVVIELEDAASFRWVARGTIGSTGTAAVGSFGGAKTLSAALDMIRFTTVNGTDAFDTGEVNILYE